MSEEQNLFETAAAAPPPTTQNEEGSSGEGGGSGGGTSKSRRRRRKRKNKAAQAAGAVGGEGGATGAISAQAAEGSVDVLPGEFRQAVQGVGVQNGPRPNGGFQNTSGGFQNNGFQNSAGGFQNNAGGFQNNNRQNGGGFQGQDQGSRRKKKKFKRAGEVGPAGVSSGSTGGSSYGSNGGGQPRPEPGNSFQGSNSSTAGRRVRKFGGSNGGGSRGPRTFVGPMDHSYREANGNFADGPASTIPTGSVRHRNNGRPFNEDRLPPELMHHHRPVAIAEDAPTHIYFFIEDLFFTAKIQEAARLQGVKVAFMKPDKDVVAHLSELPEHEHPSLIVIDLNNAAAKPLTLIPKLKAKLKKGTSILGFLSHLQGDLKQKAVEAGCHTVMPRSAFSQNLPNLLRRYGVEDEVEVNFNQ